MAFNRKQKLRDNIEAIRTAFILDRENRTATTEERAILQRYCGFGGLKCILNPAKELTDAVRWAKSDLELFAPTVELHRLIRENSKDETEYKRFVDSLKASVLTAFYTPKEITDTIADVLADYSVRPARMLDRRQVSACSWISMLRHSPNADVMAFEKDLLTGTILRHLYPDQKMRTLTVLRKSKDRSTIISTWRCPTFRSVTLPCSTRSFSGATLSADAPPRKPSTTISFSKDWMPCVTAVSWRSSPRKGY